MHFSDKGNSGYSGTGKVKFMHGQEKAFVEIKMPKGMQDSKKDDFQIELLNVD